MKLEKIYMFNIVTNKGWYIESRFKANWTCKSLDPQNLIKQVKWQEIETQKKKI